MKKLINFFNALRYIPQVLARWEKITLIILALVLAVLFGFAWYRYWINTTRETIAFGGTYTEGIVGETKDLNSHLTRLVGAGLTRIKDNGEIDGDLAQSWQITDSGKTYTFKMRDGVVAADLTNQVDLTSIIPDSTVSTPDDNTLILKLKQSFNPCLYVLSEPNFQFGPYKIVKEDSKKITLQANANYWQGKPHIAEIIFYLFQDEQSLLRAIQKGEVMGFLTKDKINIPNEYNILELDLPRQIDLFFNLAKTDLKNVDLRQKLKNNQVLDKDYNFTLATSDLANYVKMAEDLKARWEPLKAHLTIKKYSNVDLEKNVLPKRDYDFLIYGINYGADPDPYPFWHSSQIQGGLNLANFSNFQADKLLEDARQTTDFQARLDKYNDFYKILDEQAPIIVLEKEVDYYAISPKVKGLDKIYGASEADRFLNVNNWYLNTKRVKK